MIAHIAPRNESGRGGGWCRDRSFCCGGGYLSVCGPIVNHEEMRMDEKRLAMSVRVGAYIIVPGCPLRLTHSEDPITTDGFEAGMKVIDLMAFRIPTR